MRWLTRPLLELGLPRVRALRRRHHLHGHRHRAGAEHRPDAGLPARHPGRSSPWSTSCTAWRSWSAAARPLFLDVELPGRPIRNAPGLDWLRRSCCAPGRRSSGRRPRTASCCCRSASCSRPLALRLLVRRVHRAAAARSTPSGCRATRPSPGWTGRTASRSGRGFGAGWSCCCSPGCSPPGLALAQRRPGLGRCSRRATATPCARRSPSSPRPAPGWSTPRTPSGAGSSATCTTARSSTSSRSR